MSSNYPGSLDSFIAKSDGSGNIISSAHINDLQNAVVAIETELGTDPAGSLTDLKTRLAVMIANNGILLCRAQTRCVAKSKAPYSTIQSAINSITDAASDKIYTVLVFPGDYNESITLKNYVDIVAFNPEATKILQQVSDNDIECVCNLRITIASTNLRGLYVGHFNSIITCECNISSTVNYGVRNFGGTIKIINGCVKSTYNNAAGHALTIEAGTVILQNVKLLCTHADAKSIYASGAQNCRCMNVWANRDDHADVTQLITGGFNFDVNVQ